MQIEPTEMDNFNLRRDDAEWIIKNGVGSDLKIYFHKYTNHDKGNKLSIQGKDINDSMHIFDNLTPWLYKNKISHKIGTIKRYNIRFRNKRESDKEQSFKTLTIYCPNNLDVLELAKDVHNILVESNYHGWDGVEHPTSYTLFKDGIYYRNDRDESGNYVRAMLI